MPYVMEVFVCGVFRKSRTRKVPAIGGAVALFKFPWGHEKGYTVKFPPDAKTYIRRASLLYPVTLGIEQAIKRGRELNMGTMLDNLLENDKRSSKEARPDPCLDVRIRSRSRMAIQSVEKMKI